MNYDHVGLLILSAMVSLISAYTGFQLFLSARHRTGASRHGWVAASAVALGGGTIWSMHFIAMLAIQVDGVTIVYEALRTAMSLLVAIGVTAIALSAVLTRGPRLRVLAAAGSLMGLGVASMHYIGMSAMIMSARMSYDAFIVSISVAIAILASIAALWLVATLSKGPARFLGAIVMAAAVTSMHHVAMAAVEIQEINDGIAVDLLEQEQTLSNSVIALCVAFLTLIVLGVGILASIFDRRVRARLEVAEGNVASAQNLQEYWQEMLDGVPQMIWSTQADGTGAFQNRRWIEFTGTARPQPNEWVSLIHPEDSDEVMAQWRQCIDRLATYKGEYRLRHQTGDYRWVSTIAEPQLDDNGVLTGWIGICTDIDERIEAENELATSQAMTKGIIEASPDCVGVLDTTGTILFMNKAFGVETNSNGMPSSVGQIWGKMFPLDIRIAAELAIKAAAIGETKSLTFRLDSADGNLRWWDAVVAPIRNSVGQVFKLALIARDITQQKVKEEEVRWTATHDTLTNLPSRSLLQDTIAVAIADNETFCFLILDVDNFKHLNDTLGHDTGDALLIELGKRLVESIEANDFVARIGGDEFAVILRNLTCRKNTHARAQSIADNLREPWIYNGRNIDCSASIGASLFPEHGKTKVALMKNADIAMYASKASNRGEVTFFEPQMLQTIDHRATMLSLARLALTEDLIFPCYQPIVELGSGRLAGFEALLRWRHDTRGVQQPHTIEEAFGNADLAIRISDRMIMCVLDDVRRWLDKKIDFGYVTINATESDFRRGDFAEQLLSKLEFSNVPASCIQIEVTETVFLGRGSECVDRALTILSEHGVKVALDDFGTGYGSLTHLRQFPVDVIKIDRSFVQGLPEDNESLSIVNAVINLGRSLNIRVVAEGVETLAQESVLAELGCPLGQGFLYAKALPASLVPSFIGPLLQRHGVDASTSAPNASSLTARPTRPAARPGSPSSRPEPYRGRGGLRRSETG